MDEQEFDKISISSIVERAGVSRQSFYRNYTSKEDVIIEIEEVLLRQFSDSLNDPKYNNDLSLWLEDLFRFLLENKKPVGVLYKAGLADVLFSKAPFILEDWMGEDSKALHYYIVGSLGALNAVALEWFNGGMNESPKEMAKICMKYDIAKIV